MRLRLAPESVLYLMGGALLGSRDYAFVERIERVELWNDCVDYVEGYENAAPAANETKRAANAMVHLCQGLISIADERDRMTK